MRQEEFSMRLNVLQFIWFKRKCSRYERFIMLLLLMLLNGYFSLDFGNPNSCGNNRKRIRTTKAITATIREGYHGHI